MDLTNQELLEGTPAREPGQIQDSVFTELKGVIMSLPDKDCLDWGTKRSTV